MDYISMLQLAAGVVVCWMVVGFATILVLAQLRCTYEARRTTDFVNTTTTWAVIVFFSLVVVLGGALALRAIPAELSVITPVVAALLWAMLVLAVFLSLGELAAYRSARKATLTGSSPYSRTSSGPL